MCDHDDKAALLWSCYRNRVGINDDTTMLFNLSQIITIQHNVDFEAIEAPFTAKEIDDIIKEMPADKSPGPNGFNGAFMKKCWPLDRKSVV